MGRRRRNSVRLFSLLMFLCSSMELKMLIQNATMYNHLMLVESAYQKADNNVLKFVDQHKDPAMLPPAAALVSCSTKVWVLKIL